MINDNREKVRELFRQAVLRIMFSSQPSLIWYSKLKEEYANLGGNIWELDALELSIRKFMQDLSSRVIRILAEKGDFVYSEDWYQKLKADAMAQGISEEEFMLAEDLIIENRSFLSNSLEN